MAGTVGLRLGGKAHGRWSMRWTSGDRCASGRTQSRHGPSVTLAASEGPGEIARTGQVCASQRVWAADKLWTRDTSQEGSAAGDTGLSYPTRSKDDMIMVFAPPAARGLDERGGVAGRRGGLQTRAQQPWTSVADVLTVADRAPSGDLDGIGRCLVPRPVRPVVTAATGNPCPVGRGMRSGIVSRARGSRAARRRTNGVDSNAEPTSHPGNDAR